MTFGSFLMVLLLSSLVLNFTDIVQISRVKPSASRFLDKAFALVVIAVSISILTILSRYAFEGGADPEWRRAVSVFVTLVSALIVFGGVLRYIEWRKGR